MTTPKIIYLSDVIAPCGMNCGICMAFLREKNHCPGCNSDSLQKPKHCTACKFQTCPEKQSGDLACYDCSKFPCLRLKQLDKRYRTKYGMSMIENLLKIKEIGIAKFVEIENARWACPDCGYPINVHRWKCSHCGKARTDSIKD
ncbi:MAG: DUF3795 domain-containing protein [Candidatus Marinimicrobia bacterium]|nr:DUF3795 domain-containing protein [Candidatus Neomarinimicrobiota bacterium]